MELGGFSMKQTLVFSHLHLMKLGGYSMELGEYSMKQTSSSFTLGTV